MRSVTKKHTNIRKKGDLSESLNEMLKQWRQKMRCFSFLAVLPTLLGSTVQAERSDGRETAPPVPTPGNAASSRAGLGRHFSRPDFLRRQTNYLLPHQRGNPNIANAFTGGDNCPGTQIPNGTYSGAAPFADGGDTTGANNTVGALQYYYYADIGVGGPDQVYTFTLTSRGTAPEIRVTPSATYDPAIYIINGRYGGCPSGPGASTNAWSAYASRTGAGLTETIAGDQMNFLPLNVPHYLFIDSNAAALANSGQYTVTMKDVTIAPGPRTKFDFDRNGVADLSVFRPSNTTWYVNFAPRGFPVSQFTATQFGLATDRIVPADYDGDGSTDIAVFRDGTWYWIDSLSGTLRAFQFGSAGDIPQPADYDGDGRSELAVFRSGIWYTQNLQTNQTGAVSFGLAGDKPVAADYDGDGRADYAVVRNGVWYLLQSQRGFFSR